MSDDRLHELRIECEQSLASAALTDPEVLPELSAVITREDFSDPFMGEWFQAACDLQKAGRLSRRTLKRELSQRGYLESTAESRQFIELGVGVTGGSARYYAEQLLKLSQINQIERLLSRMSGRLGIDCDLQSVANQCSAELQAVCARESRHWEQAHDIAESVYREMKASQDPQDESFVSTLTGFSEIDSNTGGMYAGQLWMLAAKSYMGKTTIALSLAQNQLDQDHGVYFASYEMEGRELLERLYSSASSVPLPSIVQRRLGQSELVSLLESSQHWSGDHFCIDDRPPSTIEGLQARVSLASAEKKVHLVVIDHLLLLPTPRKYEKRHQFLVEATAQLKQMAKALDCTVLVLNQVNMTAEGRPTEKDLAQSKELVQNLDVLCMADRSSKTDEDLHMDFLKNRKGAPFQCWLKFFGEVQRVEDLETHDMDNYEPAFTQV